MSAANPTQASLWAGRIFTALVFLLAVAGVAIDAAGGGQMLAISFFAAAGLIYLVGTLILYLQRDYIMRLFGCGWPLFLPKVDELQLAHRQKAFAATFATFTSLFAFGLGIQLGMMLMQLRRDEEPLGFLPSDPEQILVGLCLALVFLSIAPQAYLAWTLTPLEDEDAA